MKRTLLLTLLAIGIVGCIPCPAFAQIAVKFQTSTYYYDITARVWTTDKANLTDTLVIPAAGRIFPLFTGDQNGWIAIGRKPILGASTGIKWILYRATYPTTDTLEMVKVDSLTDSGAADTLYQIWNPAVQGAFAGCWYLRATIAEGTPSAFKININIQ